ncbi:MAG: hypothetical protein ACYCPQ_09140 [Elusimicrobiota bacterium]
MRLNKRQIVLFVTTLAAAVPASGYQVRISSQTFAPSDISSVFGEARCTSPAACNAGQVPTRFHKGVDIAEDADGNSGLNLQGESVQPIEDGTVTSCFGSGSDQGIRIAGQHIFDYIHIQYGVPQKKLGHLKVESQVNINNNTGSSLIFSSQLGGRS